MVSVIAITASVILFYRAETIRWVTYDDWTGAGIRNTNSQQISFGIYSPYDLRWFLEDYLAVICFVAALSSLLYGVWLRKTYQVTDSVANGDKH